MPACDPCGLLISGMDSLAICLSGFVILAKMCPENIYNRVLAPACDRIKEPRVSWHSFRHAHATLLAESGESMKTAQALLGHSDLETTLNVYTHALPASQRRAVERVSEVMFSIVLELGENEQEGKSN
jgi:integrase